MIYHQFPDARSYYGRVFPAPVSHYYSGFYPNYSAPVVQHPAFLQHSFNPVPPPHPSRQPYARALSEALQSRPDVFMLLDSHHGSTNIWSHLYSRETTDQLMANGYRHVAMEFLPTARQWVKAYLQGQISREQAVKRLTSMTGNYGDPDVAKTIPAGIRQPTEQEGIYLGTAAKILASGIHPANIRFSDGGRDPGKHLGLRMSLNYLNSLPGGIKREVVGNLMKSGIEKAERLVSFFEYGKSRGMHFFVNDAREHDRSISHADDRHFLSLAKQAINHGGGPNKIAFMVGLGHQASRSPWGLDTLLEKEGHTVTSFALFRDTEHMQKHFSPEGEARRAGWVQYQGPNGTQRMRFEGTDPPDHLFNISTGQHLENQNKAKPADPYASQNNRNQAQGHDAYAARPAA